MTQTLEQLKKRAARLARDNAIRAALQRANVRGKGLAVLMFLESEDRINVAFDANNQPVVTVRDEKGTFISLDMMLQQMKVDPEWQANFADYKPRTGVEDPSTGQNQIEFADVSSAIRDRAISLQDLASGAVTVKDSREHQAALRENEVSADALMTGQVRLEDLASGMKVVRFG
jgi:hypothetical protein